MLTFFQKAKLLTPSRITSMLQIVCLRLEDFLNTQQKRLFLMVFNKAFQGKMDGREVVFHQRPSATGVIDHLVERGFRMSNGLVQLEFAQYGTKPELFTSLNDELLTTTVLIFFCQWLLGAKKMEIDVEATINTNARLIYLYRSPSVSSIVSVLNSMNVYELDPKDVHFARTLTDSSNESLRVLYEELTYGMVTKDDHPLVGRPYMELNLNDQYLAFEHLRKILLG
jgi:hypothetical protein